MTSSSGTYGLPLYTEELGRVPLHSYCAIQNWQSDPMMTMPTNHQGAPATATAAAAASAGLDPNAASIFALPQTLYEQAIASGSGSGSGLGSGSGSGSGSGGGSGGAGGAGHSGGHQTTDFSSFLGGMGTLGGGGSGGSGAQVGSLEAGGVPFSDSDTLAMWSNAPAGFECVFFFPFPSFLSSRLVLSGFFLFIGVLIVLTEFESAFFFSVGGMIGGRILRALVEWVGMLICRLVRYSHLVRREYKRVGIRGFVFDIQLRR